jgi:hypothetical protein
LLDQSCAKATQGDPHNNADSTIEISALECRPLKYKKKGMVGWGKRKTISEQNARQTGCTVQTKCADTKTSGPEMCYSLPPDHSKTLT